ncbi:small secreted protein [Streptomyces sp. FXJ1.4098]|uniref:small secreted protein n=1 Tax=Streptomyces sp. NPDC020845 TaxID=3365096 RepID=UPI00299C0020|nr:small secreted protein [Streptomyces sp. FXJ1.4098]
MEGTNPVNKKLVAALSGGAALVVALTGCGGGGGESNKKVNDWAKTVCDEVQPQLKKIQSANAAIQAASDEPDSKKLQQTDSQAFGDISEAYAALGKAVQNAGAPPVEGGEQTQKQAVKELNSTSKAYKDLQTAVDKLDTSDKAKFAAGLNSIADDLKTLSNSGDKALQKLQEGEVGKAMAKQPGCQKPKGTSTASPS